MSAAATAFLDTLDDSEKKQRRSRTWKRRSRQRNPGARRCLRVAAWRVRVPQLLKWTENESAVQMDVTGENGAMPVGRRAGLSAPHLQAQLSQLADHTKQAAPSLVAEQKGAWQQCAILPGVHGQQFFLLIVKHTSSERHRTLESQSCGDVVRWYLTAKLKPHSELLLIDSGEFMEVMSLDRGGLLPVQEGGSSSSTEPMVGAGPMVSEDVEESVPMKKLVAPSDPTVV